MDYNFYLSLNRQYGHDLKEKQAALFGQGPNDDSFLNLNNKLTFCTIQ